jgi:hypothetical protein
MNIKATTVLLALTRGNALTLDDARGALVRVLTGRSGSPRARPQGSLSWMPARASASTEGPTVVEAARDARFVVEAATAGALEGWWHPAARSSASV